MQKLCAEEGMQCEVINGTSVCVGKKNEIYCDSNCSDTLCRFAPLFACIEMYTYMKPTRKNSQQEMIFFRKCAPADLKLQPLAVQCDVLNNSSTQPTSSIVLTTTNIYPPFAANVTQSSEVF